MNALLSRRWCDRCSCESLWGTSGCCHHPQPRATRRADVVKRTHIRHHGRPRSKVQRLRTAPLTHLECRVAALVANNATYREIARELHIALSSAHKHVQRLREKFDIYGQEELARHLCALLQGAA